MRKNSLRRNVFIYRRLMGQSFRAITAFHEDFVILLISSAMTQILGIIFLWVIYQRIPTIQGWAFWEVAFIYAMIFFSEGFASLLFEGCWTISTLVNRGELDRMLVRPVSPILQIVTSRVGVNGVSNIVIGSIIIIQALSHVQINWTLQKWLLTGLLLISAIIIRGAINFISNCSAFWTQAPNNSFAFMVHSISDFAKYPISIYGLGLQAFITVVIPYAFVSFFPAVYIFDKGSYGVVGLLSPLAAIYCVVVALLVFFRGLRRYESAGN